MLGIWHGGDWLEEIFGSTMSMVGWYVEVPNLVGSCLCLIKAKFSCFFTCIYVALIVVILWLFLWLYVDYKHRYVIGYSHGPFHVFTCN